MRIEIRNVEAENIFESISDLVDRGYSEQDLKLIVYPEEINLLAEKLSCDPLEIEEGTKNLRIKGCDVEIEART